MLRGSDDCFLAAGKGSALSMFVSGCLDSINFTPHKNSTIRQKVPENWKELAQKNIKDSLMQEWIFVNAD